MRQLNLDVEDVVTSRTTLVTARKRCTRWLACGLRYSLNLQWCPSEGESRRNGTRKQRLWTRCPHVDAAIAVEHLPFGFRDEGSIVFFVSFLGHK